MFRNDKSRTLTAKRRAMTRKAERRAKEVSLFLAVAFPATLDGFQMEAR